MKNVSKITFGRFFAPKETSEAYETKSLAGDLYDEGKFQEAYAVLFQYLQGLGGKSAALDIDNETGNLTFKILQGSKVVKGYINANEVAAEAEVAKFSEPGVALFRFLLAKNADLIYSKFSIAGNSVFLGQKCPVKDMSLTAFQDMLTETAIFADGIDEMIEDEFPNVIPVDYENTVPFSKEETTVKTEYLRFWLSRTFVLLDNIESETLKSYVIMSAVYKIMYLISPEGLLLNKLRKIVSEYGSANDDTDYAALNYSVIQALKKIAEASDGEIEKSMFRTQTFFPEAGYTDFAATAQSAGSLLQLPLDCSEDRQDFLVVPLCEYIAGSHLCGHGMPEAAKAVLTLFFRILNAGFFHALGFGSPLYSEEKEQFMKGRISAEIQKINDSYSKVYTGFEFEVSNIDFSSRETFAYTFLVEFINLQITD